MFRRVMRLLIVLTCSVLLQHFAEMEDPYDPQDSVNKTTLARYSSMFDGIYQIIAYDNDTLIDSLQ